MTNSNSLVISMRVGGFISVGPSSGPCWFVQVPVLIVWTEMLMLDSKNRTKYSRLGVTKGKGLRNYH